MFKDIMSIRKCTNCNGKGYNEESTETHEHGKPAVKIIMDRPECYHCRGTGKEEYVSKYALIKNIKYSHPLGVEFNFLRFHNRWSLNSWSDLFSWISHEIIWKLELYKVFDLLKIPYGFYRVQYEGTVHFDLFGYSHYGGDYLMPDYYGRNLTLFGITFASDWSDDGSELMECKKCGDYIPKSFDKETGGLCCECEYPEEKIIIEPNGEQA